MKTKIYLTRIPGLLLILLLLQFTACQKQDDWLDAKSRLSDVTPKTLTDFQAVLDNTAVMNSNGSILGLVGSDNIYIPDANLDATDQTSRNAYLWAKDIYQGGTATDWNYCYQVVEYSNIVLDGLDQLPPPGQSSADYRNVSGSALFYRAYAFYQLCQLYATVHRGHRRERPGHSAPDNG